MEDGIVKSVTKNSLGESIVKVNEREYRIPNDRKVIVKTMQKLKKGDMITDGNKNMSALLS